MKYTHAKFLHTLGASLALGSLMAGCAADTPPAPVTSTSAANTGPANTQPAAVPPTGVLVPPSSPAPTPTGTGTVAPTTTGAMTTPTTAPTVTDTTTMPTVAPTGTDRPIPGMPTATPTTTPTMAPTGGATVPPDVLPTMDPTTEPPDEEDPPAPMGEGNALTPTDELWIAATTNGVGVVGSWYEFHDEKSTDVAIAGVDGVVCLTGTTGIKETDADYGAGMGLNLNDEDDWDGSAFSGLSFDAEITADDATVLEVRFSMADTADTGKEHRVMLKASNSIAWDDLEQPTWVTDAGDDEPFDPGAIIAVQVAVPAGEAENEFSICVSNMVVDE